MARAARLLDRRTARCHTARRPRLDPPSGCQTPDAISGGLVISVGPDEFIFAGTGLVITFETETPSDVSVASMLSFPSLCMSSKFLTMDYPFPTAGLGVSLHGFGPWRLPGHGDNRHIYCTAQNVKPPLLQRKSRASTRLTVWQLGCPSLARLHGGQGECSRAPAAKNGTGRMDCNGAIPPVRKSPLLAPF